MNSLLLSTHDKIIKETDDDIANGANVRIYHELKRQGNTLFARYLDLIIDLKNKNEIQASIFDKKLNQFDVILPRTTTYRKFNLNHGYLAEAITLIAKQKQIRVLNGKHFLNFSHDFNKLFQQIELNKAGLPIPKARFIANPQNFKQAPLPSITKPLTGSKGFGIKKISQLDEIVDVVDARLFQEQLPHNFDYRVIVLNNTCLGAMKKTANKNKVVTNFSAGGTVEAVKLTAEMKELSLAAAELFDLELSGIDLMLNKNDQLQILEVNRFPSFIGFQKSTGINVAQKIVQFLVKTI